MVFRLLAVPTGGTSQYSRFPEILKEVLDEVVCPAQHVLLGDPFLFVLLEEVHGAARTKVPGTTHRLKKKETTSSLYYIVQQ